jgi:hypothetical protein
VTSFESSPVKATGACAPQVQLGTAVANFRIDLVVKGPQARMAVECDGVYVRTPKIPAGFRRVRAGAFLAC